MSIASIPFSITNASAPFEFSVKDSNGIERFLSADTNTIFFTANGNGEYTVTIKKGDCVRINKVNLTDCSTISNTGCSLPVLTLNFVGNDKRASFIISSITDCQGMTLHYSEDINFNTFFPVIIGCVSSTTITFPTNSVYYVRILKTCINNTSQFSNIISLSTIVEDNNCYTFAECLRTGLTPNFDSFRINLRNVTTKAIAFTLSNGSIINIPVGSDFGELVVNVTNGCPTVTSNSLNIPYCPIAAPIPPCIGIKDLSISGTSSVYANSTNQFSLSYTGNTPLNYTWGVSGQGTSIVSGKNADTATIKFGSSGNFILYLDITDSCGNVVSATKQLTLVAVNLCDIVISNINIVCNSDNNSTVTVLANSPSGKILRYGILGFANYQVSNIFNLPNSDINGYTFQVVELGNEVNCRASQNRMVSCLTTPVPTPTTPTCNLVITNIDVTCNAVNNATLTVNVTNPSNFVLEYQIDNYITWQNSNVFTGITNSGTGYTVRVRNKNNISCTTFKNEVYVDCVNTTPTCNPITNLVISGNTFVTANSQNSYTSSFSGTTPITYLWTISGQGTVVLGANNLDTATFQFGSSNGTITLQATNCSGSVTTTFLFSTQSTANCNKNVNFTVIYDVGFQGNTTAILYKKCGETTNSYIGDNMFQMRHNQSYTLPDCSEINSIMAQSGNAKIIVNSSVAGC